jgi:methylenetetrahydrofolate dehydrogenase (NADP+)/methenyltetrahydrofolate cyclohydrolase
MRTLSLVQMPDSWLDVASSGAGSTGTFSSGATAVIPSWAWDGTALHSRSTRVVVPLGEFTRQADILIVALGKPGFVTADMVKPGAVVVDVGITRVEDSSKKSGFRIAGDVDFDSVKEVAAALSPVPGGVGLMTIVSLLQNTLKAHQRMC